MAASSSVRHSNSGSTRVSGTDPGAVEPCRILCAGWGAARKEGRASGGSRSAAGGRCLRGR